MISILHILSADHKKAGPYKTLLMLFDNLLRLLFKDFLSSKSCKTDKASAEEKHGCWFGNWC
jgi:hypothetical protein